MKASGTTEPEVRRLAPRPLALHMAAAVTTGFGALAALPAARAGLLPWAPALDGEAGELTPELRAAAPEALAAAVAAALERRLHRFMAGIEAYRAHPYARAIRPPKVAWREGTTRLLDFGPVEGGAEGAALLFVPSLINRYYVLDLMAESSLVRWLASAGRRVLVVDWDAPGEVERNFTVADYVTGRLERLLDAALELAGGPPVLAGYCLGGTLSLGLASRRAGDLAGLALLAAPWDFHAGRDGQSRLFLAAEGLIDGLSAGFGELPVDVLQALFAGLDPNLASRKFRRFATLAPESPAARRFVALEDWLNDGVPVAAAVARECLLDWYGANLPARGLWRLAGHPVRPEALDLPAFVAIPGEDRIVPPASAEAILAALPEARVVRPRAGHIGMMVGGRAERGLWRPLLDWLGELA